MVGILVLVNSVARFVPGSDFVAALFISIVGVLGVGWLIAWGVVSVIAIQKDERVANREATKQERLAERKGQTEVARAIIQAVIALNGAQAQARNAEIDKEQTPESNDTAAAPRPQAHPPAPEKPSVT